MLSYTGTASNSGNVPLSGVELKDLLVNSGGKECGTVAIGGSCEISGDYTVTQADVDAGKVENTATGSATELTGEVTASRSTAVAQKRELTLTKSATESGFGGVGETLNYSYEVTNSGTVTLTGTVSIADDKIGSEAISCGTVPAGGLGPGGKVTCSGSYETVQGDVDGSGVTNRATASVGGVASAEVEVRVPWQAPQGQTPQLTLSGAGGSEDAGTLEVTVTLAPASVQTVEVDYATGDVTAAAGTDYTEATGTLTLAPGATVGKITVAITDDAEDEEAETFTVSLSDAVNATVGTGTTTVTITDDDTRGVTVSKSTLTVTEGSSGSYTVVLDSQPTGDVTVTASASGSTDVTVSGGALTFTATTWNDEQTVTVSAAEDTDAVNDTATVSHAVAGGDYGSETAADVAVTVGDNETASTAVALTVSPASVSESADATTVAVTGTLNNAPRTSDTAVTVTVGATGDTATEGTDYATVGTVTVTITAGETSGTATFSLEPTGDAVDEADESLAVTGSTTVAELTVSGTTVTITDDDTRGVTVSKSALTVPEGSTGTYTVVLDSQPTGDVTVTASASGSTDVTVSGGALTFTATSWKDEQTVTVSAGQDADAVNDTATVSHAVAGGDYGSETAADVAVTVGDNETASTAVALTVSPASVSESADATTVAVTGTLNNAPRTSDTAVTVTVGATGDTATEGTDYATVGTVTVTITAGETSGTATFSLEPTGDAVDEADESLAVTGSTTVAELTVSGTMVTITDDDTRGVTVSKSALTVPEGSTGTYTVVLDSQPTGDVTVTASASGSTDVTVSGGALTFTATTWNDEQTVTVSAAEDTDAVNDTATVSHAVAGGDYGSETAADVAVTVGDNETASTAVALTVSPASVSESADATTVAVTGTLNNAPRTSDTAVTVTVGATGDTATEGTDYATVGTVTVTITAGETSGTATFSLEPTGDAVDEADESLAVTGSTTVAELTVSGTTVTITDDDTRGVTVSKSALTVPEGSTGTYTVVLDSQPTGDVTVTASASGSTDVTVSGGALTFTATSWKDEQTVTVSAGQDADAVNDTATVSHAVAGGDYGSETAADVAVTVGDNETASTAVALTVSPASVAESADATTVTVTGTLNNAPRTTDTTVTVAVGATGDPATEGTDYATVGTITVTITAGETSGTATFSLEPTGDAVDEADETLAVTGSTTESGLTVSGTTVTITDDDTRGVTMSKSALTVTEGSTGTYTVVLDSQPTGDVTVTASASGSTDVTVSGGALTFTALTWKDEQTVTVSAAEDADAVNDTATVSHTVAGGDYGSETATDVAVTVGDNEAASTAVALTVSPASVSESADATTVAVTGTLNNAPRTTDTAVTVTVGATEDQATEGTDYATVGTITVTITAGETSGTAPFSLEPTDDEVDESDETLAVTGSTTVPGLTVTGTTVTITDDDTPGDDDSDGSVAAAPAPAVAVSIAAAAAEVTEGQPAVFAVTRSGGTAGALTVPVEISEQGSVAAGAASTGVTFAAGAGTVTLSVATVDDETDEPDGAITATLSGGTGYVLGSAASATVAVTDNDAAPRLSIDDVEVAESAGEIAFSVRMSAASDHQVTVVCTSEDVTATAGEDYEAELGTLVLEPGQTSGTIRVPIMDDTMDEKDETFMMKLSSPVNATLTDHEATGTIMDDDPSLAEAWLVRFGRTVAGQVVDAVVERVSAGGGNGARASVAGRRLSGGAGAEPTAGDEPEWRVWEPAAEPATMEFAELLAGSSFELSVDKPPEAGGAGGGQWSAWGRGGTARMAGETDRVTVEGQVTGGVAGADYDWGPVLAGVSAAYHGGTGEVQTRARAEVPGAGTAEEVTSWLVSVHPYVGLELGERATVWAVLGHGRGGMTITNAGGDEESSIWMTMGAAGARGELLSGGETGGINLAVKSDGMLLRVGSEAVGRLPEVAADVQRARVALEGSVDVLRGPGGVLTPTLEVGARYDGGAAETGAGLEVGGGLSYAYPAWGLTAAASGRLLVAHEEGGFEQWGAGGSLRVAPGQTGSGPKLTVSTAWGEDATGVEQLWSQGVGLAGGPVAQAAATRGGRLAAELGYGIAVSGGVLVTPFAGVDLGDHGARTYRLGSRLALSSTFSLSLQAERREHADTPVHELQLSATLNW